MTIVAIVLFVVSLGLMIFAHYSFIVSSRFVNYDRMGASMAFDRPFVLSILLLCIALPLIGLLKWYFSFIFFIILVVSGMLYKWKLLDRWVRPYRQNY